MWDGKLYYLVLISRLAHNTTNFEIKVGGFRFICLAFDNEKRDRINTRNNWAFAFVITFL